MNLTWFLVLSLVPSCPIWAKPLKASLQPLVCTDRVAFSVHSSADHALRAARAAGCAAEAYEFNGLRRRKMEIRCETVMFVDGKKI